MEYYAIFSANNGTSFMRPITGSNKCKLLKDIREIALANMFAGSSASWYVDDANGKTVYGGAYIPGVGIRYEIYNYKQLY